MRKLELNSISNMTAEKKNTKLPFCNDVSIWSKDYVQGYIKNMANMQIGSMRMMRSNAASLVRLVIIYTNYECKALEQGSHIACYSHIESCIIIIETELNHRYWF
jgi:hypothetical protein